MDVLKDTKKRKPAGLELEVLELAMARVLLAFYPAVQVSLVLEENSLKKLNYALALCQHWALASGGWPLITHRRRIYKLQKRDV